MWFGFFFVSFFLFRYPFRLTVDSFVDNFPVVQNSKLMHFSLLLCLTNEDVIRERTMTFRLITPNGKRLIRWKNGIAADFMVKTLLFCQMKSDSEWPNKMKLFKFVIKLNTVCCDLVFLVSFIELFKRWENRVVVFIVLRMHSRFICN